MISITDKPKQTELETCIEVLEWIVDWHEKNEPYATVIIDAARTVLDQIPFEVEEF